MKIRDIIWLLEVEEKIIVKHHVWPEGVEAVLQSQPYVRFMERGHVPNQDLYAAFGRTLSGRYLTVLYILKESQTVLIVTARDMTRKEKKTYGRRGKR